MPAVSPLRLDPTRTAGLRRAFIADLRRRFAALRQALQALVVDEDAFGLRPTSHNPFALNQRWAFQPLADKLRSFGAWLAAQAGRLFGGGIGAGYVERAFGRGAERAFDTVRRREGVLLGIAGRGAEFAGARQQLVRSAFGTTAASETVRLLADRTGAELRGVTDDLERRLQRTVADGLAVGASPRTLALALAGQVNVSTSRAAAVARNEVVRAFAEGQLAALEQLGVREVGVEVEWVTTSGRPCPRCTAMEGRVFPVAEAHGLIPLHPGCLCVWAVVREPRRTNVGPRRGGR